MAKAQKMVRPVSSEGALSSGIAAASGELTKNTLPKVPDAREFKGFNRVRFYPQRSQPIACKEIEYGGFQIVVPEAEISRLDSPAALDLLKAYFLPSSKDLIDDFQVVATLMRDDPTFGWLHLPGTTRPAREYIIREIGKVLDAHVSTCQELLAYRSGREAFHVPDTGLVAEQRSAYDWVRRPMQFYAASCAFLYGLEVLFSGYETLPPALREGLTPGTAEVVFGLIKLHESFVLLASAAGDKTTGKPGKGSTRKSKPAAEPEQNVNPTPSEKVTEASAAHSADKFGEAA